MRPLSIRFRARPRLNGIHPLPAPVFRVFSHLRTFVFLVRFRGVFLLPESTDPPPGDLGLRLQAFSYLRFFFSSCAKEFSPFGLPQNPQGAFWYFLIPRGCPPLFPVCPMFFRPLVGRSLTNWRRPAESQRIHALVSDPKTC